MSPSVLLSLLLGSLYGLLWHACLGRRPRHLPLYWLVGVAGFFAGYALAVLASVPFLRLGPIPLPEATLGSLLALGGVWWILGRRAARVAPGEE